MPATLTPPTARQHDVEDATRRELLAGGLGLGATFLLGCGGDERRPAARGGSGGAVTIEHKYGSTRIPAVPQRVVSVGDTDQDPILALGVRPIAVRDFFGDKPSATWPWAQRALGDARPEVLAPAPELQIERIAALRPDLIVGTYSALKPREYELLSRIAPTVAQSGDHPDFGQPWDEITITVGRALGREARARELVAGVERKLEAARREHPEFAGKSAVVASASANTYFAYTSTDNASRFLAALGFQPRPQVDELATQREEKGVVQIGEERLDLFDADLLCVYENEAESGLLRNPVYTGLDVHTEGRAVFLGYELLGGALTFSTVLSLPFAVDRLVPVLSAAVDGDPATTAA